jgi:hypothetical protein
MKYSPLQRLAQMALDEDPGQWAARQRAERFTWQQIADQLGDSIGMDVSRETVRLWATPHLETVEAK